MSDKLSRRDLLTAALGTAAAFVIGGCSSTKGGSQPESSAGRRPKTTGPGKLAVGSEKDAGKSVRAAVAALGGMSAFVKKGDFVVIKPNAAWGREPDMAATTHPDVLLAVSELCKEAGAGDILVIDHLIDQPSEMVLALTGLKKTADKAGVRIVAAQNQSMYRKIDIPDGKLLKSDEVLKDVLKADVFINLPKAKTHGETKLTLGLKNLMGVMWNRQAWHSNGLHQSIADFATAVRPDLTILDATRILLTNGPKGPGETKDVGQVIAGTDLVAVDAYGATLFGMKPEDIEHIRLAHEAKLGEIDFARLMVK
ncbi:MAG TPA: DUF362 domain-containing protein [Armatimonadota bacterium]|nr:DUF362 domain-containing protein [Armatimonadota bacterium]HOP79410.1 DUF362 domain-containing protein [Armatimonadota bacterium]